MLPGRLGVRFALEALFLILLAIGAGLADLRPALILLVMAIAWVLVAVIEFTAERIAASPLTYLLPARGEAPPAESDPVSWPMVEERTVVAPPDRPADPAAEEPSEPAVAEAEAEPAPAAAPGRPAFLRRRARPEAPVEPEAETPPADEPAEEPDDEEGATASRSRLALGERFRRRRRDEEPEAPTPPRHVKLLPRRSAPAPSRATEEVAELFGPTAAEDGSREDSAG